MTEQSLCKAKIQEAERLFEEKRFEEAAKHYDALWQDCREHLDHWDGWRYAHSLYRSGRYEKAIQICEEVQQTAPENFDVLNNTYTWALYKSIIKKPPNEEVLVETAEKIIALTQEKPEYSPYVRTILEMASYYKDRQQWEALREWIERLTPDQLSNTPFTFRFPDGTSRELASELEEYYSLRSTALLELQQWDACIQCVDEAFENINKFHYHNDVWLMRRKALALAGKGQYQQALDVMKPLLKKKKEWFLWSEMAELYNAIGNNDEALKHAAEAALARGDIDKKVNLWQMMGDLYFDNGLFEHALAHWALAFNIRQKEGWSIPTELQEKIDTHHINPDDYHPIEAQIQRLSSLWQETLYHDQTPLTGTIDNILPHGKAGFIKGDDGKSYFFHVSEYHGPLQDEKPPLHQKVTFYLKEGFDKKKNRPAMNAVFIRPVT